MTNQQWQQRYIYYMNENRPGYFWKSFYDYRHHCMGGHWYLSEQTGDAKLNFQHMVENGLYDMDFKPSKYNVINDNLFIVLPSRLVYKGLTFLFKICLKGIWFLFLWILKGCINIIKFTFKQIKANKNNKIKQSNYNTINISINYCPYCGKQIKSTDKFCPYCGRKIK